MGIITRILGLIILLLLIAIGIFLSLWQHDRVTIEQLQKQSIQDALTLTQKQNTYNQTIDRLNIDTLAKAQSLIDQQTQARKDYESQLQAIESRYHSANSLNQRLSNQIRLLNRQLPTDSTDTLRQYASTAGDNLTDCSTTTTELERLARTYYAAYEQLRALWPVNTPPTIRVVDQHGYQRDYTTPVQLPVSPEQIKPYTP